MANGKSAEASGQPVCNDLRIVRSALRRILIGLFQMAAAGMERSKQRRELATLSDPILKDLGLSRADVEAECRKHFWQP